jgi:hypothetical protein
MQMTESKKLLVLRDKPVCRRREIVDSFQTACRIQLHGSAATSLIRIARERMSLGPLPGQC